jgi:hypothetical protein
MISITYAVRVFYTVLLVAIVLLLLREIWLLWFSRQLTFGDLKYFDGPKPEDGASNRLRHMMKSEYESIIWLIKNQPKPVPTSLLTLSGQIDTAALPKAFEPITSKATEFSDIDLTFQGINVQKLLSSFRTYLSPSVDLKVVVLRQSPQASQVAVHWPSEVGTLVGPLSRFRDYTIEVSGEDQAIAKALATYLVWLQAFDGSRDISAPLKDFGLWSDGLRILQQLRDEREGFLVNPPLSVAALKAIADRFALAFDGRFSYRDVYRVASDVVRVAGERDPTYHPQVEFRKGTARISAENLSDLLSYYYVYFSAKRSPPRTYGAYAAAIKSGTNQETLPNAIREVLHKRRVHPFSSIVDAVNVKQPAELEAIIVSDDRMPSAATAAEMTAMLRVSAGGSELAGTAFLISENIALTSVLNSRTFKGKMYVERAILDKGPAKFERVDVAQVVDLGLKSESHSGNVVALRLASPLPGVKPFRIAQNSNKVRVLGRSIHTIAIAYKDPRLPDWLLSLYKGEFKLPAYLYGTVLRYDERDGQLAYDVLTTGGSAGAPVIDNRTGAVIAINYLGQRYGDITKIAAGVEIMGLGANEKLAKLLGASPPTIELTEIQE